MHQRPRSLLSRLMNCELVAVDFIFSFFFLEISEQMTLSKNIVGGLLLLLSGSAHMMALGFLCKWRRTNSRGGVNFSSVPLFISLP